MVNVIIRTVTITETHFNLHLEFDFALEEGSSMETYELSVSKPDYLFWKETTDPVANTVLDYITSLVKPHYEKLLAQKELAVLLKLKDKELTW